MNFYCQECGSEFEAKKSNAKWCSSRCSSKNYKRNNREHVKKKKKEWDLTNIEWKKLYERERLKVNLPLKKYRKIQHRQYSLKTYFNLSEEQYNELLQKQDHCCAICKQHESQFNRKLAVDHNHTTGEIRGLLCTSCNRDLIRHHENIDIFKNAAYYLENSKTNLFVPEKYLKGKFEKYRKKNN